MDPSPGSRRILDISWIWGYAKTAFYHSNTPITIPLKNRNRTIDTKTETSSSSTTLVDICKDVTPPCRLNPLLFNGHLQTLWTTQTSTDIPIHYKRRIFTSNDPNYPGTFATDFVSHAPSTSTEVDTMLPPRTAYYTDSEWTAVEKGSEDTTPMLIALHGLSGGSHELYLRHVLDPLVNPAVVGEQQWEALVVTARGCAKSKITSPILFNARATWDMRQVVRWVREKFPSRPLFAVGFSLGANILVDYLGEEGAACELTAAVVCSNPWDLHAGSLALQRSWVGREIYSKHMADGMRALFEIHLDQISKHPMVDIERVRNTRYLHEFDRELQGPSWGYPTEGAYYRDASSTEPLLAVRIPLFALHAEDDPVAPKEALPFQEIMQTPYAVLCTTTTGGHLSWFESGGGRWFVTPAVGFLRKMAQEVDLEVLRTQCLLKAALSTKPDGPIFDPMRRKLHLQP